MRFCINILEIKECVDNNFGKATAARDANLSGNGVRFGNKEEQEE
jgi:hypothetical protein